ncbi:MAG: BspA family leucine-rich repeat surface protein, partial [Bacteroidales bacterium]|nr:BspA family leucine-rich repeat surface protein [Bacteroidales bacterium]
PQIQKELKVFTGTLVDDATRVGLVADGDIYHVTWNLGDRIWINEDYEFTATVGDVTTTYFAQDTTGERPDEPPTAPYTAFWPKNVMRGLPGVQNYVPNSIEFIPMAAESSDEVLPFKNLVGLLKLNIKTGEAGIKVKSVVITADQGLSGAFTIEDGKAVVTGTEGVTLNCSEGVEIGSDPVPFLVSVPANTYTGMTVKVYSTDGKVASVKMKSGASFTVERSKVYAAEFPFNGFTQIEGLGGTALLPAGPDFNATLKNLALETEGLDHLATDEEGLTRIIFNTLCPDTEGLEIQDLASEKPIYVVYDKVSGVAKINTPAETIMMPEDASFMFAYFGALTGIDNMKCLNTENVTTFQNLFCYVGCSNRELRHIDLSSFRTPNLINTRSMFNGCRNIESLDLSNFDFSQDTSMAYMFQYCINLADLNLGENFNTENVMNMQSMFRECYKLPSIDLSKFKTDLVERMDYMFYGCESVESLDCSSFNTECVERMDYMFGYCTHLLDVNVKSFDTENCTLFNHMFYHCEALPAVDLSSFNTENATKTCNLFWHCWSIKDINLTGWSWDSATDVRSMFNRCDALEVIDVSMLDGMNSQLTTSTTYTGYFFYHDKSLREIYAGDTFRFPNRSTYFMCASNSTYENRPGSVFGSLTIYCDQDIADWFASTGLRWIANGYNSSDIPTDPIPVTFKHYKSGNEITVTWWDN